MSIDKLGEEIKKLADMVIEISAGDTDGDTSAVIKYMKKHESTFRNMSDADKDVFDKYIREMRENKR